MCPHDFAILLLDQVVTTLSQITFTQNFAILEHDDVLINNHLKAEKMLDLK
jgi:hypothetical protein